MNQDETCAGKQPTMHKYTQLMLDSMPFPCHLWDSDYKIFDCNKANLKFFKLRNKQELLDNFFAFSPEYQPDGQRSDKKGNTNLEKTFRDGEYTFEWMHQDSEGTPLPMEVTLVRVRHGNDDFIASYTRDLREQKCMMQEITQRDTLLAAVNQVAAVLLRSESDVFEDNLRRCLGIIAAAGGFSSASIWQNSGTADKFGCRKIHYWSDNLADSQKIMKNIIYDEHLPEWKEVLSHGNSVHSLVRDMSAPARKLLSSRGVESVFVVPVFWQNQLNGQEKLSPPAAPTSRLNHFWGMITYANYKSKQLVSRTAQSILHSGAMMCFNALLRNDMAKHLRTVAAELEAIIASYSGIIWSVDQNEMITLYKGTLLEKLKKIPSDVEGKKIAAYFNNKENEDVVGNIRKTFTEGIHLDWVTNINGIAYHARTTPIFDDSGHVTNVMGSFDDITEMSWLQTELNNALKAAQEANRAKDNFLAKMSHEMRTPLNAIIGLSELLSETSASWEECCTDINKINSAGRTLLNLVNDLLDISKIGTGKFELLPSEYDTASLLNDAINQSILYVGEKPIEFILDIDENMPLHLYGDGMRVKQIMNNLLSNAFKYTNEGVVELGIDCVRDGDAVWMTVRVRDTGMGIRPEDLRRLFTEYVQLKTHAVRGGTGLGLSIAKRMAEIMGGSITVESEYEKGSIFTARFPQKFVDNTTIGPKVRDNLKTFRYTDQKHRKGSHLIRIDLSYARVLVVDDILTNLDVSKGMLKPYGMRIDCVTSGQQAIDAIRTEKIRYNAIFMDHMMPEMDGMEATKIIRESINTEYAKTIPIIALTANAIAGNEDMFLQNGFQDFLPKPIDTNRLDAVVRKWVRNKELEKKLATGKPPRDDRRQGKIRRIIPTRRNGTDRRILGEGVVGLHIKKGIQRFGGDEQAFLQILRSFAVNTRPLLEKIEKVQRDTLADYAITVHGIKGSSRGICADMVGDKAEALEKAAKSGDFDFVYATNPAFLKIVRQLIADIEKLLEKTAAKISKPKKDKPDKETLKKLSIACKNNDMDEVDAAMSELEIYEYESDDGLMAWLRENVAQINLEEIQEKLSSLSQ